MDIYHNHTFAVEFARIIGLPNITVRTLSTLPLQARAHEPVAAGAIVFTVIALFSILSYFAYKSRIPLAALLLQVVMDVSKHHTSVYFVAFTALILQAALCV